MLQLVKLVYELLLTIKSERRSSYCREVPTEKGDKVRFRLSEVFLPSREDLRSIWAETTEVEGTIIDFSDAGVLPHIFAVVEVQQTRSFVVPLARLTKNKLPDSNGRS